MTTKLDASTAVIETLPDPPLKRDMQQLEHLFPAISALAAHFARFGDVLVSGQGYLIASMAGVSDWGEHYYPDCVVALGVDPTAIVGRNGYVIADVGKPPEFVMEFASETMAPRDVTVKPAGYAALGVSEYWRFDGSGKGYYPQPLAGDLLVKDRYEPIELTEESDGEVRGYSPALSLYLCSDAQRGLRFWDPAARDYLPTYKELREAEAQASEERDRERSARIEAERRAAEAEAELARLRNRLHDS